MHDNRNQKKQYMNSSERVKNEDSKDLPLREGGRENYNENRLGQIKFPK